MRNVLNHGCQVPDGHCGQVCIGTVGDEGFPLGLRQIPAGGDAGPLPDIVGPFPDINTYKAQVSETNIYSRRYANYQVETMRVTINQRGLHARTLPANLL